MNIVLVSAHFHPKNTAAAVRIVSFIDAWAKNKCNLCIVTEKLKGDSYTDKYSSNVRVKRLQSVIADNTRPLAIRVMSELLFSANVFFYLLLCKADVYFVTSPPFLNAMAVMFASKIRNIPYVVDIRDLYPEQLFNYGIIKRNSILAKMLIAIERKIYNHSYKIVAVTEGMKRFMEENDSEAILIRNGIDARYFYPIDGLKNKEHFIILFHGNLGISTNINFIIKYAGYLKHNNIWDIAIWVIGNGPKKNKLLESIELKGLDDIIDYKGVIAHEKMPAYINASHIGFSPLEKGLVNKMAFPVKIYECLGCGLPVIVSPESEAGYYVEERRIGFQVGYNDVEQLHEHVLDLMHDKQLYLEYAKNAADVTKEFDRLALADKLYRLVFADFPWASS